MKKRFGSRMAAAALSTALMVTAAGCGKKEESKAVLNTDGGTKITTEPTELSLFFISGLPSHIEELEVWQAIAKDTNVSIKTVSSKSASDETTAFNTLMASGDLPDMVIYSQSKKAFPKYGMEGAFEPLNDLIDKYGSNVQKILEDKDVRAHVTAPDGNIYFLTSVNPKLAANGWFIRQDWLDKLGLEVPTTVEEYHDVLLAFRNEDPNGNGQKDEVPYFHRFGGVDHLILLFDTITNWEIRGDKIVYGPTTPEFKNAYVNIAQWYQEGIIDKEIYTRGSKSRDKLLGENVGGSTHDYFGSTAQFNDFLAESVPGINFMPIAPPNGKEFTSRELCSYNGIAISSTSEKKEIAMKYIDYVFSDAGRLYTNFGIEGKHYDMNGDYPTFQDWVLNGEKTTIDILEESGAGVGFPSAFDFRYEEQWLPEEAKAGMNEYLDYILPPVPVLSYTSPEEEERFNKIMTDVRTYIDEITQKWVFGSSNVEEDYEGFIAQIKKLGMDEATEIQQAAYDRYLEMSAKID